MEKATRWWCRAGGLAAISIAIGYAVIVALYVPMGAPPHGAEARLAYIGAHPAAWWAILALSVLTDLLFLPLALALHQVLKAYGREVMMMAVLSIALFVILDLALTWTNYAVLIQLSGRYTSAGSEAAKAAVVATAEYPTLVVESNLLFFYNTFTLAIGILLAGAVMRRGAFGKTAAYLGIATGVLGIISVVGPVFVNALGAAIVLTSILTAVWALVTGVRLWALGR